MDCFRMTPATASWPRLPRRPLPRRFTKVPALALGIACCAFGGDWTTSGADAQRSSWVRADPRISPDSMRKPGFQLAWKVKLASELTPPALLDRYIGYRGFRSLGFLGAGSDNIYAIDTDLGRIEWQKHFSVAGGGC